MKVDKLHGFSGSIAMFSLLTLAGIMVFLFASGLPLFKSYSLWDFISGVYWYPSEEPPLFGILPMLTASVGVTLLAACFAVPLGLMSALFLTELAPEKVRRIFKPVVELLAALPSVVIGFFGMAVVAPFLQNVLGLSVGLNLFSASLMLAFMSVPTICSVSEDALKAVPVSLREASLSLGATRWETTWKVVVPSAKSGIGTAVILGMSRSIGETMVVLMVAGGANIIPLSLFDPVRPMTSTIAAEMAETPMGSPHYHALFAIGIILFLFSLMFNLMAQHVASKPVDRVKKKDARRIRVRNSASESGASLSAAAVADQDSFSHAGTILLRLRKRRGVEKVMFGLVRLSAFINLVALLAVCALLLYNGLPVLSLGFLTEFPAQMMTAGGIWPCIIGTLILSLGAMALAFPLGVISAVYLHEYAGQARIAKYIRLGVNNLAGVPSIVFGLFGFSFFAIFCNLGVSIASGVLTLTILTLPVIISTAEEALRQVPDTLREASLALGATKPQTICRAVLPMAMPGMLTGAILGMARAAGETAAIMFTATVIFTPVLPNSLFSPVMTLPYHVYTLATSGVDISKTIPLQYGTSLVLVVLVLSMNLAAIFVRDRMQKNRSM